MKAGKNPTRRQKIFLRSLRINPDNWFVTKDTPDELHLVHRHFDDKTKIIKKRRENQ